MAKMISNRHCVVCGKNNVMLWTLDNMRKAVVTYLCKEHGEPLLAIMELAGDIPPEDQIPVPDRSPADLQSYQRSKRETRMAPLLDWTPPEEFLPPQKEEA